MYRQFSCGDFGGGPFADEEFEQVSLVAHLQYIIDSMLSVVPYE